jgi:hypothetical protein
MRILLSDSGSDLSASSCLELKFNANVSIFNVYFTSFTVYLTYSNYNFTYFMLELKFMLEYI